MNCIVLKAVLLRGRYRGPGSEVDLDPETYEHHKKTGHVDLKAAHLVRARALVAAEQMTEMAVAEAETEALKAEAAAETEAAEAIASRDEATGDDSKPHRRRRS